MQNHRMQLTVMTEQRERAAHRVETFDEAHDQRFQDFVGRGSLEQGLRRQERCSELGELLVDVVALVAHVLERGSEVHRRLSVAVHQGFGCLGVTRVGGRRR